MGRDSDKSPAQIYLVSRAQALDHAGQCFEVHLPPPPCHLSPSFLNSGPRKGLGQEARTEWRELVQGGFAPQCPVVLHTFSDSPMVPGFGRNLKTMSQVQWGRPVGPGEVSSELNVHLCPVFMDDNSVPGLSLARFMYTCALFCFLTGNKHLLGTSCALGTGKSILQNLILMAPHEVDSIYYPSLQTADRHVLGCSQKAGEGRLRPAPSLKFQCFRFSSSRGDSGTVYPSRALLSTRLTHP